MSIKIHIGWFLEELMVLNDSNTSFQRSNYDRTINKWQMWIEFRKNSSVIPYGKQKEIFF